MTSTALGAAAGSGAGSAVAAPSDSAFVAMSGSDFTTPLCREVVRVYVMEGGAIAPIKIYGVVVAFMHRVATKRRVIPEARVPLGILRLNRPCCRCQYKNQHNRDQYLQEFPI